MSVGSRGPVTEHDHKLIKKPGLPNLVLINVHPKFLSEQALALSGQFRVDRFYDVKEAWRALKKEEIALPRLIVVGFSVLQEDAGSFMQRLSQDERMRKIPLIVTGSVSTQEFDAFYKGVAPATYLKRPFLKSALLNAASHYIDGALENKWQSLPETQKAALVGTLDSFVDLTERIAQGEGLDVQGTKEHCRNVQAQVEQGQCLALLENVKGHHNYTYVHSLRVSSFLGMAAHGIGIKNEDLLTLTTGGLLHDVGKIATPQEVLNCPTKLDDEEWRQMKEHVSHTHRILKETPNVSEGIRIIAEQHHEKLDGTGYPLGLKASQLSELARLSTIADIFSALTDERSYKPAFTFEKSFNIMESMTKELDLQLLAIFKECMRAQASEAQWFGEMGHKEAG